MKEEKLVSVIVPIYNAEQYLKRCIDSFLSQTYKNIEIVLVNDGSTDSSAAICQEYKINYPEKIKYIEQKNAGVSRARNRGLLEARGDFVTFVDADDFIDDNYCEKLIWVIYEQDVDMVWCNKKSILPSGKEILYGTNTGMIHIWKSIEYEYYEEMEHRPVWGVLYKKKNIEKLKFPENIYVGEDAVFFAMAVHNAIKIAYIDLSLYNYVVLEESAYHGPFDEKKHTEIDAWEKIVQIFGDRPLTKLSAEAKLAEVCISLVAYYIFDSEFVHKAMKDTIRLYRKNLPSLIQYDRMKHKNYLKHAVAGFFPHICSLIKNKMLEEDEIRYSKGKRKN